MVEAYKTNIKFQPAEKVRVLGDTATKELYGTVLSVGSEVKDIKAGDIIQYTQWGTSKVKDSEGVEHFYIPDDPMFILGVDHNPNEVQG